MKILKHKYFLQTIFLLMLISCKKNEAIATFSSEQGIAALKEKIKTTFDKEKEITSLSIAMQTSENDVIEQITIFFPENNKNTMWFYSYATNQLLKPEATETIKNKQKTKMISAFSFDESYTNFKHAIALIEKETNDFSNYRIHSYDMTVDQNSGEIEQNFIVFADKKSAKPTFYGKKIGDKLYRFSFQIKPNQSLKITEGLNTFK